MSIKDGVNEVVSEVKEKVLEVNDKFDSEVDSLIDQGQSSRFSSLALAGAGVVILLIVVVLAVL